jgi:2-phospho-L-lactate transferase/gluconeogenesis factor (CofD/UPF0052 family)
MLNVAIINGGRGAASLMPSLLSAASLQVTSIVNAYDDGKSTGEIRRFFGMLGPSDIRKVQELMLPEDHPDFTSSLHLFQFRYSQKINKDSILGELEDYAKGRSQKITGVIFQSSLINGSIRAFINEFIITLKLIEKTTQEEFNFSDCSIMNCIYAGAFIYFNRNIEAATIAIDKLFNLKGSVLSTNIENKKLVALRENGQMLYSEAEIVELRSNVKIEKIYLLDQYVKKENFDLLSFEDKRSYLERHHCFVEVSPTVKNALSDADIIIYSSGTQHSSLYPSYLSVGLARAIAENKRALKIFVTNIGADYESPSYKASDFIKGAYRYLKLSDSVDYKIKDLFSYNLINSSHNKADETYVQVDESELKKFDLPYIVNNYESSDNPGKHDGSKLLKTIMELYESFDKVV